MTAPANEEYLRARFEQWARDEGLVTESHGFRSENSLIVQFWIVWQAACEACAAEAETALPRHSECGVRIANKIRKGRR